MAKQGSLARLLPPQVLKTSPARTRGRATGSTRARRRARAVSLGLASATVLALVGFPDAAAADFAVNEGQSFSGQVVSVVQDCGLGSSTIDWGDGTPTSTGSPTQDGKGVQGTHTYVDEGTYDGVVTYYCTQLGNTHKASFAATVQDAALTGTGRDVSGTAGQSLTAVVAHVNDANPGGKASNFTAEIAWGDGSTSAGSVTNAAGGGFDVTSTHTYGTAGSFPISTSITDVGGSSTTVHSTAQLAPAPPAAPRSFAAPVVSGEPREEETLTATTGNWSDFPTDYQYQWLRCATTTGDNCVVVPGATASTYAAVHDDVGKTMRARVRAHNAAGTSLPADSGPTAVVQPFVLRARFTIAPNPTCTGVPTTFDASSSKTPDPPITRYTFTTRVEPIFNESEHNESPVTYVLADGTSPRATAAFDWNYQFTGPGAVYHVFAAEPRLVTLTVTDGTGATASYSQEVDFAQPLSIFPRIACPERHVRVNRGHFATHRLKFKVTTTSMIARVPCMPFADCSGTLQLVKPSSRRGVVLANSAFFFVPGHRTATIRLALTRAGRALVARRKPLTAIARLTTVNPTGRATTQSFTVTLIGKRKRR